MTQIISFIVAFSENRVMGKDNQLPWRLPDDLAFFKTHTLNKPIIMGRKTWNSLGKPLPNRLNIVISRNQLELPAGVLYFASLEQAILALPDEPEIMIIGGAQIFKLAENLVNKVYFTKIHANIEGDILIPEFNYSGWNLEFSTRHEIDDRHNYAFTFEIWNKTL